MCYIVAEHGSFQWIFYPVLEFWTHKASCLVWSSSPCSPRRRFLGSVRLDNYEGTVARGCVDAKPRKRRWWGRVRVFTEVAAHSLSRGGRGGGGGRLMEIYPTESAACARSPSGRWRRLQSMWRRFLSLCKSPGRTCLPRRGGLEWRPGSTQDGVKRVELMKCCFCDEC